MDLFVSPFQDTVPNTAYYTPSLPPTSPVRVASPTSPPPQSTMANAPQRNYSATTGTRLFKQCPAHGTRAVYQTQPSTVSLDTAIRLVSQAVHQDTAKNYAEAARCYREAIAVFHAARDG